MASYPKSGNTWTKIVLSNYLINPDEPLSINEVGKYSIGDAWADGHEKIAGPAFDRSHPYQHLQYRHEFLRRIANNGADVNLVKTHNLNGEIAGVRLIPAALSKAAIYILRHPFDIAISYARHMGITVPHASKHLSREDNTTKGGGEYVKQFLGSWSVHVESWTSIKAFPVHVIRYEDMKQNPEDVFGGIIKKLNIPFDSDRLAKALKFSSFEELQKQEAKEGFREASSNSDKFFHSGTTGQWKGALSEEDQAVILQKNEAVMREFGYA